MLYFCIYLCPCVAENEKKLHTNLLTVTAFVGTIQAISVLSSPYNVQNSNKLENLVSLVSRSDFLRCKVDILWKGYLTWKAGACTPTNSFLSLLVVIIRVKKQHHSTAKCCRNKRVNRGIERKTFQPADLQKGKRSVEMTGFLLTTD